MKTYSLWNRVTQEQTHVKAASAQEACASMGWLIGDCHVKEIASFKRLVGQIKEHTWKQRPDVIEEDGQRLGAVYEQVDVALLSSEEIHLLREEQALAEKGA
jgi:hypothetical protein